SDLNSCITLTPIKYYANYCAGLALVTLYSGKSPQLEVSAIYVPAVRKGSVMYIKQAIFPYNRKHCSNSGRDCVGNVHCFQVHILIIPRDPDGTIFAHIQSIDGVKTCFFVRNSLFF
ncbi:MAG: hypothetical protein WBE11_17710, partial [Candidatus Aminicenantaceae bacterium]